MNTVNIGCGTFSDIFEIEEKETNPFANPEMSNNGGGYSQPSYIFTSTQRPDWKLFIDDTSCGDFGTRFSATLVHHGEKIAEAFWGSMEENSYTDFLYNNKAQWPWIYAAFLYGIYIPCYDTDPPKD